jgi:hypothetical protein
MSKHTQSTSEHWKVSGDGHNGENILHELNKQQFAQAQERKQHNSPIPGQNDDKTVAERGDSERAGDATASSNSSSSDY